MVGRCGRGVQPESNACRRGTPRWELLPDRWRDRSTTECARVLARDAAGRRDPPRTHGVPRAPDRRRRRGSAARHGRAHSRRRHRHGTRDPHGRTEPAGGGQARRCTDLRRRSTAPGRRHRTASRLRRRTPADGLRCPCGDLLATRRRWVALGHVEPEGKAGARARDRLGSPSNDATPARCAGARDEGAGHPQGVVRNHRLHAGSPADPRPRHHHRWHGDRGGDRRLAGRSRHDVGPGRRASGGRPRPRGSHRRDRCVRSAGMDRFDEHGRSPFYDPIALPFPPSAEETEDTN